VLPHSLPPSSSRINPSLPPPSLPPLPSLALTYLALLCEFVAGKPTNVSSEVGGDICESAVSSEVGGDMHVRKL